MARKVWLDGKVIDYKKAVVPIMTHSLQYGSGIFEGMRAYETKKGPAIFRLKDHLERFRGSAKIYFIKIGYSSNELQKAVIGIVKTNKITNGYIRPFIFYNDDTVGVSAYGKRISVFVAAFPFGAYYGKGKEHGIRCKISSWRRINSEILPVEAKASGNYLNSVISNFEARASGFDEAILLSTEGHLAEGSSDNIFLVKNNKLITPSDSADILLGITRDSIMEIAGNMGLDVQEREVHKEELYSADEVFFTGTAAEVTPITNIDGIRIGRGHPGPITRALARRYDDIVHGRDSYYEHWLTYVR